MTRIQNAPHPGWVRTPTDRWRKRRRYGFGHARDPGAGLGRVLGGGHERLAGLAADPPRLRIAPLPVLVVDGEPMGSGPSATLVAIQSTRKPCTRMSPSLFGTNPF